MAHNIFGPGLCLFMLLGTWTCSETDPGATSPTADSTSQEGIQSSVDGESVDAAVGETQVTLVTTMGSITMALKTTEAPLTTQNFLSYVDDGFYDGDDGLGATTFHRVISGFMVQGGGVKENGAKKTTKMAIINESTNGLLNLRGTVAMARTNDPHSATSQFFINHIDNPSLDYDGAANPGYAVFAEVVDGMDVVDAIAAVQVDGNDAPLTAVVIEDVFRP